MNRLISNKLKNQLKTAIALACLSLLHPHPAHADDDEYQYPVRQGETLESIARNVVGDTRRWQQLQQINQVRDPRRIPVGTVLRIPLHLMRLKAGTAGITYLIGTVTVDGKPLTADQRLGEGAQLQTGDNGFVTLSLPDQSQVAVPPNSSIKLDFLKQSEVLPIVRSQIYLQRGRVESHVIPDGSSAPRLKIKTRQAVVGVRGTVFRVAVDDALDNRSATHTEVLQGSVKATPQKAGEALQIIEASYGAIVNDDGPQAPQALSLAPDLSAVPRLQNRPIVRIPLPAMPGATAFRVAVSTDEKNRMPFAEDVFPIDREAKFSDIPDGEYWLHVRAIAPSGLEGHDAILKIELAARPEPPFLMQPASQAKLQTGEPRFQW
ncbi:MAG: FecR domain-containing protein, partial [Pseudomonadota bacterium]